MSLLHLKDLHTFLSQSFWGPWHFPDVLDGRFGSMTVFLLTNCHNPYLEKSLALCLTFCNKIVKFLANFMSHLNSSLHQNENHVKQPYFHLTLLLHFSWCLCQHNESCLSYHWIRISSKMHSKSWLYVFFLLIFLLSCFRLLIFYQLLSVCLDINISVSAAAGRCLSFLKAYRDIKLYTEWPILITNWFMLWNFLC